MKLTYTLFCYNTGDERDEYGTHDTVKQALKEQAELEDEVGCSSNDFEIVVNVG